MPRLRIAPSILSADFSRLGEDALRVERAGADYLHIDVMDGHFVNNITIGPPVVYSLRRVSGLIFDVHLMIEKPERYIDAFIDAGADIITVHAESTYHVQACLQQIKKAGKRAAVAINPGTPVEAVKPVLEDLDMVLLMTVNPGFGGQAYIPSMTKKIREMRRLMDSVNPELDLEVDGGINVNNVREVTEAGANVIVAGSAIYNSVNIPDTIKCLRENANFSRYEHDDIDMEL